MNEVVSASRSLGERVKGLLFEPSLPATKPQPAPQAQAPAIAGDDEAYRTLRQAALARPTEYTDLLGALSALRDVLPDGETRLNAALAVLHNKGVDLPMVLRALDVHKADLDTERHRFDEVAASEVSRGVSQPAERNQQLDANIAQRQQQLAALQAEIDQLNQQRAANADAIREAESRIVEVRARFDMAFKTVAAELEADRARLAARVQTRA